jgi:electron transport complex protein RnfG
MAKLQSTFKNMFLSLSIICLTVALVLAQLNTITTESIAEARAHRLQDAIMVVVPEFDNDPVAESFKMPVEQGDSLLMFPAKKNGKLVGFAVHSFSNNGFSGNIQILVGFDMEGRIVNYSVLHHTETPGLGDKMEEWFRPQEQTTSLIERIFGFEVKTEGRNSSIIGRNLSDGLLFVTNDGGDIDAITASTITARAFLEAVNKAYTAFREGNVDVSPPEVVLDIEGAIQLIFSDFDNAPIAEAFKTSSNDSPMVFPIKQNGELIGYAIHSFSDNGRNGSIHIMVGLDTEGNILDYYILHHRETPEYTEGVETWFKDESNPGNNIIGRNLSQGLLILADDGGNIDGITGSTRTTRALLEAINDAVLEFENH